MPEFTICMRCERKKQASADMYGGWARVTVDSQMDNQLSTGTYDLCPDCCEVVADALGLSRPLPHIPVKVSALRAVK